MPVSRISFARFGPMTHGRIRVTIPLPNPELGLPEHGVVGGDRDVAGHGQLARAGQAVAVDSGDRRLREPPEPHRHVEVALQHLPPGGDALDGLGRRLLEVEPGGERPAGAPDHDDANASSASTRSSAAWISRIIARLIAFSTAGRSSVSRATAPSVSSRIVS